MRDYDVYKIFLRRGTGYKACISSAQSDDGWVSLWVTGLGHYSSAYKVYWPNPGSNIPGEVSSKPVCTNVNPKVTGPHMLHAKVGALYRVAQGGGRGSIMANTALNEYWVWYEEM